jgi:hypothetical protein
LIQTRTLRHPSRRADRLSGAKRIPLHPAARSGNCRDDLDAVEVFMLRSENLTIEVFIDEDDDGITYAETLMFATRIRRLLARGSARIEPNGADSPRISNERIAAVALLDLVRALNRDQSGDRDGTFECQQPQSCSLTDRDAEQP